MNSQTKIPPAHKFGFCATTLHFLPGEDPLEFEEMHEVHRQHLHPQTELEEAVVYQIAVDTWLLRRVDDNEQAFRDLKLAEELKKAFEWAAYDNLNGISEILRRLFEQACSMVGTKMSWSHLESLREILKYLLMLLGKGLEWDVTLFEALRSVSAFSEQLPTRGDEDFADDFADVGDFAGVLQSMLSRVTPIVSAAFGKSENLLEAKKKSIATRQLLPDGRTLRLSARYRTRIEKQRARRLAFLVSLIELRAKSPIGNGNTVH